MAAHLGANVTANIARNLWAYLVIFCGHFPDGVQTFDAAVLQNETRPEWYLRQMLGTANFNAGPVLAFSSGNLCYQIEHHLFPDLPSNRYANIATQVRALCTEFDLPYITGSLSSQYLQTLRTIHTLELPDDLARFHRGRFSLKPRTDTLLRVLRRTAQNRPIRIGGADRTDRRSPARLGPQSAVRPARVRALAMTT